MAQPRIEILGVFRLPVTEEFFREQFETLYGDEMSAAQRLEAERACREQLSSTVLIEALVKDRDRHFDVGHFTQPSDNQPEDSWQVAWAEAFLTSDGAELLVERWDTPPEDGDLRIAFFMHWWDPMQPLRTSYGEIMCPEAQEMPERLQRLVPYEPVD